MTAAHVRYVRGRPHLVRHHVRLQHADERLLERTNLNPEVLHTLRRAIRRKRLPPGSLHVALQGGHHAQLKQVAPGRHVVATVLRQNMQPEGTDVTHLLTPQREFLEKRAALLLRGT